MEHASEAEKTLFEALRLKRLEIAKSQQVPPYLIFHDSVLWALVKQKPKSLAAMRSINGIGEVKLERYGELFLQILWE